MIDGDTGSHPMSPNYVDDGYREPYRCIMCGDRYENLEEETITDACNYCRTCEDYLEYKKVKSKKKTMEQTKTKLIHFTDLSQKDNYYLLIDDGIEIRQQEINYHEYIELKNAENGHYKTELTRLKEKYRLIEEERTGA